MNHLKIQNLELKLIGDPPDMMKIDFSDFGYHLFLAINKPRIQYIKRKLRKALRFATKVEKRFIKAPLEKTPPTLETLEQFWEKMEHPAYVSCATCKDWKFAYGPKDLVCCNDICFEVYEQSVDERATCLSCRCLECKCK